MFLHVHGPYLSVATPVIGEFPPGCDDRCGPKLFAKIDSDAEYAFLWYGLVDMGRYKLSEPPDVAITKPKF